MAKDRLYFLEITKGRILSCLLDGSDLRVVNPDAGTRPDGLDYVNGSLYYTDMGIPEENDGELRTMKIDGQGESSVIVPSGGVRTPKQIKFDPNSKRLYFCDREGMRVMSCALDGSDVQTLVQTGVAPKDTVDKARHCVGITIDSTRQQVYWTQKGPPKGFQGRISRAPLLSTPPSNPSARTDIEVIFENLPEPIDLEYHPETNYLYWTDRGAEPRGNTLNRARVDQKDPEIEILAEGFKEAIGLALDLENGRIFVTDMSGRVYVCKADGSGKQTIVSGRDSLTGCIIVRGN